MFAVLLLISFVILVQCVLGTEKVALDEFRSLPYDVASYGFTYCVCRLDIEDDIYKRFDFVYPPYDTYTSQYNTNDAFAYVKKVTLPSVMNCLKQINLTDVLKYTPIHLLPHPQLTYDQYQMNFTTYLVMNIQDVSLDNKNYPMHSDFIFKQISARIRSRREEVYNRYIDRVQKEFERPLLKKEL